MTSLSPALWARHFYLYSIFLFSSVQRTPAWIHFTSCLRIPSDCTPAVLNWLLVIQVGLPKPRWREDSERRGDFILFYFISFLTTPWHMECPCHASDLSHSYDLSHSCGKTGSLTHCAGQGSNLHLSTPKMSLILLYHSVSSEVGWF